MVIFLACYLVDYNSFVFLVLFVLENIMLLHEGSNLQLEKQAHAHARTICHQSFCHIGWSTHWPQNLFG